MSVNAQWIKCDSTGMTDEEILRGLAVVHADGRKGWNIAMVTENECDNITHDITCDNMSKPLMSIIRERLYMNSCNPKQLTMIFFNTVNAS